MTPLKQLIKSSGLRPWILVVVLLGASLLRLVGLQQWPPAPYWEEVALGYDAYSLLMTGRDHHGHVWPVVAFESFGDYKPSGYFYALLPSLWLGGLEVWTTRLPSALAGIASVLGIAVLASWWGTDSFRRAKKGAEPSRAISLATLAALVAGVSPWLVHFSRAAWEVNVATALIVWAMVIAAGLLRKNGSLSWQWWGWLSVVLLLVASMYTYHATRVVAPIMGVSVWLVWWWPRRRHWREWLGLAVMLAVVAGVTVWPVLKVIRSPEVQTRVAQTSIFSQTTNIEVSNLRQSQHPGLLTKLSYHRNVLFGREIMLRYLSHFELSFLFGKGDENARHSLQYFGLLYHIEIVPLIIGLYTLLKKRTIGGWLIVWWWAVSIVPSAISLATPHALRTLIGAPAIMLVITIGWWSLGQWGWQTIQNVWPHRRKLLFAAAMMVFAGWLAAYGFEVAAAAVFYTQVYPKQYSADWMVGYQAMVKQLQAQQQVDPTATVWLTREQGRPLMYYWFFTKADPRQVQASNQTAKHDQGEVLEYQNIRVINTIDEVTGAGLVASSEKGWLDMIQRGRVTTLDTIRDGRGQVIWVVYRYQPR